MLFYIYTLASLIIHGAPGLSLITFSSSYLLPGSHCYSHTHTYTSQNFSSILHPKCLRTQRDSSNRNSDLDTILFLFFHLPAQDLVEPQGATIKSLLKSTKITHIVLIFNYCKTIRKNYFSLVQHGLEDLINCIYQEQKFLIWPIFINF